MATLMDCGEFLFNLLSGTANPQMKKGKLVVDGKNDSIFLKRIQDEMFVKAKGREDFLTLFKKEIENKKSPITTWLNKRLTVLQDNFEFIIWSAWKTITAPK